MDKLLFESLLWNKFKIFNIPALGGKHTSERVGGKTRNFSFGFHLWYKATLSIIIDILIVIPSVFKAENHTNILNIPEGKLT